MRDIFPARAEFEHSLRGRNDVLLREPHAAPIDERSTLLRRSPRRRHVPNAAMASSGVRPSSVVRYSSPELGALGERRDPPRVRSALMVGRICSPQPSPDVQTPTPTPVSGRPLDALPSRGRDVFPFDDDDDFTLSVDLLRDDEDVDAVSSPSPRPRLGVAASPPPPLSASLVVASSSIDLSVPPRDLVCVVNIIFRLSSIFDRYASVSPSPPTPARLGRARAPARAAHPARVHSSTSRAHTRRRHRPRRSHASSPSFASPRARAVDLTRSIDPRSAVTPHDAHARASLSPVRSLAHPRSTMVSRSVVIVVIVVIVSSSRSRSSVVAVVAVVVARRRLGARRRRGIASSEMRGVMHGME